MSMPTNTRALGSGTIAPVLPEQTASGSKDGTYALLLFGKKSCEDLQ
ncbi:MAG: hypothetical protein M1294_05450 [Firmicutes bacterium]|nr:hypothetical protein [Bacillota bacterium]